MIFKIIGDISDIEIIAKGNSIRELQRLNKIYGKGRWRKLKGIAEVEIDKKRFQAEVHWYEAHGIGKKEFKIKYLI
ncbi:MAG: hypothetical protein ACFFG0_52430 [Candidatus Thorarchaeota archaeon]